MDYLKINNDINGNPRYVFHWFNFLSEKEWKEAQKTSNPIKFGYNWALVNSKQLGGKKYRGSNFGGGIVLQSYNITDTIKRIKEITNN